GRVVAIQPAAPAGVEGPEHELFAIDPGLAGLAVEREHLEAALPLPLDAGEDGIEVVPGRGAAVHGAAVEGKHDEVVLVAPEAVIDVAVKGEHGTVAAVFLGLPGDVKGEEHGALFVALPLFLAEIRVLEEP